MLGWSIRRPWTVLAIAATIFLASLSTLFVIGTEFVPAEDRGEFEVLAELPPGTSFEQSVVMVSGLERKIQEIPEVRQVFTTVGVNGDPLKANLRVKALSKRERERGLVDLKTDARRKITEVALLKATVADPEFMQGAPTQAPISIFVRGDDIAELQRLSDQIVTTIRQVPGTVDVDSTLESGQPEMVAQVNREMAADLGFDVGSVATQLRGMVEGVVPTKLREGDKEYDIRVRLAPEFRNDFQAIARAPIYSPRGTLVRTADIARMEPGIGPTNIDREQRRRQAMIGVELSGRPLGDVTTDVTEAMKSVQMPPNFEWGFAGDVELMQESAAAMGLAMLLAVAFIYIVLASQFESFTEPFLIMLSLPLAIVGALLAILLTGNNLGMPAMIGVVMLMGLVTKNAILLIDTTNQYVRKGLTVQEALLTAGPIRLRPILMTTMAMILGMLPSALGRGEGGEFRAPISIATIGGLITSTALTLVVVPVSYLLLARFLGWLKSFRASSTARLHPAVRVTGALLVVVLVGWFLSVAGAFAQPAGLKAGPTTVAAITDGGRAGLQPGQTPQPGQAPLTLTFEDALARALAANEGLKVVQERVHESQGMVAAAKADFLPSINLDFLYTPAQRFPLIRIPAGIFGPEEQTFQASFTRRNIMQVQLNQPLYTAGRLSNAYGIQASALDASKLALERSRQELQYQVVETFYAALMNEQGVAVAEEQIALNAKQLSLAKARFDAGSVARLDVLQAEVELANSKARRIQAKAAVDTAHQALRTVLSLPQSQPLSLSGTLDERPAPAHTRGARVDAALTSRSARLLGAQGHGRAFRRAGQRRVEAKPVAGRQSAVSGRWVQPPVERRQPELHRRARLARAALLHSRRRRAAGRGAGAGPAVRARPQRRDRQRASRNRIGVHGLRRGRRSGGDPGEGARARARERVHRPGVVRERRDHVRRAQRRAGAAAADGMAADAGEVRADRRRRQGEAGGGQRKGRATSVPVTSYQFKGPLQASWIPELALITGN